jgi:hypothetical protein
MITRRKFLASVTAAAASLAGNYGKTLTTLSGLSVAAEAGATSPTFNNSTQRGEDMTETAEDPKITRARLSGPEQVTKNATIVEMAADGSMTVLLKGTNEWICTPGNENIIGDPPMCMKPMGMRWMMDATQRKPKPTNTEPGMIYMLCGATQHSNTDPFDRTSPAIPIGPHWMITWPFDALANGLPTTVRDKGAWVMFAGAPYSYLHVCGSPWEGNEYREGDKAIWQMTYVPH